MRPLAARTSTAATLELTPVPGAMPVWHATRRRAAVAHRLPAGARARAAGWSRCGAPTSATAARASPCTPRCSDAVGLAAARAHAAGRRRALSGHLARSFPAANRMQRAAYDLSACAPTRDDQRKWLRHGALADGRVPAAQATSMRAGKLAEPGEDDYPFVQVEGDGVHEIPVGPVHAGHHRARAFPLLVVGERRAAAGRAARLQAQGHREALRVDDARRRRAARRPRLGRFHGRLRVGLCDGGRRRIAGVDAAAARAVAARAAARARAHRPAIWGPRLPRQRRRASRSGSRSSRGSRKTCCARTTRCSATAI